MSTGFWPLAPTKPLSSLKPLRPLSRPTAEPLPLPVANDAFQSPGTVGKPLGCRHCRFQTSGAGFVADYCPSEPKIAYFLDFPSSDDVLERRPWAGRAGWAWTKDFIESVGLTRSDVLICNALRCRPHDNMYPTGTDKRSAELSCRQYDNKLWAPAGMADGGLIKFDPNLFVITFNPYDSRKKPVLGPLIVSDLRRAVDKIAQGYRPCVLMGTDAMELVAPWTSGKGGAQDWRGHWYEGEWPWKTGTSLVVPGFLPVDRSRRRR